MVRVIQQVRRMLVNFAGGCHRKWLANMQSRYVQSTLKLSGSCLAFPVW